MNVLKPNQIATIKTLLEKDVGQREIERKTGINRKTIRKYARLFPPVLSRNSNYPNGEVVATGSEDQNTPLRPPGPEGNFPKHVRSACEPHREWIEEQLRLGKRNCHLPESGGAFRFFFPLQQRKAFGAGLKGKDPATV